MKKKIPREEAEFTALMEQMEWGFSKEIRNEFKPTNVAFEFARQDDPRTLSIEVDFARARAFLSWLEKSGFFPG